MRHLPIFCILLEGIRKPRKFQTGCVVHQLIFYSGKISEFVYHVSPKRLLLVLLLLLLLLTTTTIAITAGTFTSKC
jgi:hypothetical protein